MKTVLIIEDNEEIRENTAELISLYHYKVLTAENGQEGFELAQASHPDIILCDMMMPETDGRYFLDKAKEDKHLQHTPVVFFSAGTASPMVNKNLIEAADEFLKKPFLEEDLLQTIERVLAK